MIACKDCMYCSSVFHDNLCKMKYYTKEFDTFNGKYVYFYLPCESINTDGRCNMFKPKTGLIQKIKRMFKKEKSGVDIKGMVCHTDLYPWYWYSYGEKCYAFAVAEAYPTKEGDIAPKPGTKLIFENDGWRGENGTEMTIVQDIANVEKQNGDDICKFIAEAHANLLGEHLC